MNDPVLNPFPTVSPAATDLPAIHAELGPPNEQLQRLVFRNVTEEALYNDGIQLDSKNIVADVPEFVTSALAILASLDPTRRAKIKVPPGLFAVIVAETVALDAMKVGHDERQLDSAGSKAEREAILRKEAREGVALREITTGALGHALSPPQMKQVQTLAGDAATPANLVNGLKAVAGYIEKIFKEGSEDDRASLTFWEVTEATATALRDRAKIVEDANKAANTNTRRVSQRELDLQDGRVLHLMDMVLRAFRLARRSDASILLPTLNKTARFFDTSKKAKGEGKPAEEPQKPAEERAKPVEGEPQPA